MGNRLARHVSRVAGEGRKFGLYLMLATQQPAKIDRESIQCDNLGLMRTTSRLDQDFILNTFGQIPKSFVHAASYLSKGEALLIGPFVQSPTFVAHEARFLAEGGGAVPDFW